MNESSPSGDVASIAQHLVRVQRAGPTNPFIRFEESEIEQSIPARFEKQVRLYPDRIAVKSGETVLTYDALNKAANRLARSILAQKADKEQPVAFLTAQSASAIVAMLGIQKAGRVCVALDAALPPARIAYMLQDSRAGILLADTQNMRRARELATDSLSVIDIDGLSAAGASDNLNLPSAPESLALIVYTSGSTGRPKGVMHSHRTMLFIVMLHTNFMHISCYDRHTLLTRYAHIAGVCGIYRSLLNGATLVPFDLSQHSVSEVPAWLAREQITLYHSATSVFRRVCEATTGKEDLSSLRAIHLTSEPVRIDDIDTFNRRFPASCFLCVMYGSTDGGVVTMGWLDRERDPLANTVSVGYPPEQSDVLVLDDTGRELGRDTIGEIATRGAFLPLGYWGQQELTDRCYLRDPSATGRRIYRSGDAGAVLTDGRVVLFGRKDDMVKVGGLQVDTGAIEHALVGLGTIKEAAVVARQDGHGDNRLVAYVTPVGVTAANVSTIRRQLARTLPAHAIPSAYVFLDGLPLTSTGKVDRRALPSPGVRRPEIDAPYVAPRTAIEETLAAIWSQQLEVERVGINDSFFDLGGHSLLAARIFADMQTRLGCRLSVATLLTSPTIAQLATLISGSRPSPACSILVPIQAQGARRPFFCVHGFGGGVIGYASLARLLGPEQPFYGLQARGADGIDEPQTSIEDMAVSYLEAVRSVQPHGPYFLGGYCYGGVVAYEMARQLEQQGEEVAHLALFEASVPAGPREQWSPATVWAFLCNLPYWLRDFWRQGENDTPLLPHLRAKGRAAWQAIVRRRRAWQPELGVDRVLGDAAAPARLQELMRIHSQASHAYQPQGYPGRVTLYRVRALRFLGAAAPTAGWSRLAGGGVEIKMIAGAHYNLLDTPYVESLAAQLRESLEHEPSALGAAAVQSGVMR
jgi:amino acid adenylation domain-containing protein